MTNHNTPIKEPDNPNHISSQQFSQILNLFIAFGETVTHPVSLLERKSILLFPQSYREYDWGPSRLSCPLQLYAIDPNHLIIADTRSPKPSSVDNPMSVYLMCHCRQGWKLPEILAMLNFHLLPLSDNPLRCLKFSRISKHWA